MKQQPNNLRKELKLAGATDAEITGLLPVATSLGQLKSFKRPTTKGVSHKQHKNRWKTFLPIEITAVVSLTLGIALVVFSRTVLPGSLLYPVQKLSDTVSMSVDPSYRETVMMKRAQQVKQLVAAHASSRLVLATLADYQVEAMAYKSSPVNYSVFEHCKDDLRQAAAIAPDSEQQAINNALSSLRDV